MSVTYQTKIPSIRLGAERTADRLIRKVAFDILADSQKTVPVAEKDGGTLKNSGHVETGSLRATIEYSAHYAAYVELGTRRMAARPYLAPAFMRAMPGFRRAMVQVMRP